MKPGDPGFEYDKRVEFGRGGNESPLEDDSWGEESDEEVVAKGNAVAQADVDEMKDYGEDDDDDDMDYFDDDFSWESQKYYWKVNKTF